MPRKPQQAAAPKSKFRHDDGWTMFELVIVFVIVALTATVAVMKFNARSQADVSRTIGELVMADLALAQEFAVSNSKCVSFTITSGDENEDDDDDDEEEGDDDEHHGQGYGHDENVRGEGRNGNGRGHGYGYGHMHHNCGEHHGEETGNGGWSMAFCDSSEIGYPNAIVGMDLFGVINLLAELPELRFDSSGRLTIVGYQWGANETSRVLMTINGTVNVMIARETGKTWLVNV
jgi:type II secretory pathway pseudopilin PulG